MNRDTFQNTGYDSPIFSLEHCEGLGWRLYMPLHPMWKTSEGQKESSRIKKAKSPQFFNDRDEALKQVYALDSKFRNGEEVEY